MACTKLPAMADAIVGTVPVLDMLADEIVVRAKGQQLSVLAPPVDQRLQIDRAQTIQYAR